MSTLINTIEVSAAPVQEISTSFQVKPLVEFKNIEIADGSYLVRKIEKGTGKVSQGCIIDALSQEVAVSALDNETVFAGYYNWLQDQAEECCKNRIEAGVKFLIPADYEVTAIAEMLEAVSIKEGRISKERITAWFNAEVAVMLQSAFKAKLGDALTDEKMGAILNSYRDCFKNLAKRDVFINDTIKANLNKALELVQVKGSLHKYCYDKVNAVAQDDALGMESLPD
jgi:hypothetical protein